MKKNIIKTLVKECIKGVLSEREDYYDGLKRELRNAKKEKNPEKILYYTQAFNQSAVAGFDRFKGSWAYEEWLKKHKAELDAIQADIKKFSYMGEDSQPEPHDAETDTFAQGPRDRLGGEENSLNISGFERAIIKPVNLNNVKKYFVYSNSDPTSLILGHGDTQDGAIRNAITNARYIKQGGVGQIG